MSGLSDANEKKKSFIDYKNNHRGSAQNWQENLGIMHERKLTQTEETKLTQGQKTGEEKKNEAEAVGKHVDM